jgi:hypothetical protein
MVLLRHYANDNEVDTAKWETALALNVKGGPWTTDDSIKGFLMLE